MVSKEQIQANLNKIYPIQDILQMMIQKHETALFTYRVGTVDKSLSQTDIDTIIEDYKQLKVELQAKFKELL